MALTRANSGAKGTRTPNPLLAKQVRYLLRHGPSASRGPSPRVARPTPDSTPGHIASTNAENFPPAERSLAVSCSVLFPRPRLE
jgi:hypothetical protein